ncbi:MAG: BON domain-containing protein [Candidatus Binatia bacterium]
MMSMSREGRTFGAVLACTILLITLLHAEEPLIRAQTPKPQQSEGQDSKALEPKTQEPRSQESKGKELKPEETAPKPVTSLILAVKLALMADQRVFPHDIEVETKDHEAVLSGKVSSKAEKIASAEVARSVEGVKSVVNKLEVVKELRTALIRKRDHLTTECIKEVFKKSATLKAADFNVKTENGIVELSGKTRFQVIALEAAQAARQVPGVKAVKTDAIRLEAE